MISGFIILIERIKIETMHDWGDVKSIGMRTTRIRILDKCLGIVPNSVIGRNQVENYTYRDSSIRVEVVLGIDYESDLDLVEKTIEKAVLSIPSILEGKVPIVELTEFGDSTAISRVQYWLKSYNDVQL